MKSLFKSKTFWFNVGAGFVWASMAVVDGAKEALNPGIVAGVQTVGNIALRLLTNEGATVFKPAEPK